MPGAGAGGAPVTPCRPPSRCAGPTCDACAPQVGDVLPLVAVLDDLDHLLARRQATAQGIEHYELDATLARRRRLVREMREWLEARVDLVALQSEQPPAPLPMEAVGLLCMLEAEAKP